MNNPLKYPRLRWPLDIRLERIDKQQVLIVGCPLGISEKPLGLIPAVGPILACFEGQLSVEEIAERFKPFGVEQRHVEDLIKLLDEHLFMASPRFYAAEQNVKDEFLRNPVRKAALAGLGYSNSATELHRELESYLCREVQDQASGELVGLIAPHIDYRRGGRTYGCTYQHLRARENVLYILIGTAHQYSRHLFHLTLKDFDGPLGTAYTDKTFMRELGTLYGWERSFADELLHKREHALELQLPFIMKVQPQTLIAPILVGNFNQMLNEKKAPEEYEVYETFMRALSQCVSSVLQEGRRVCVIAGIDLAHIGTHFGDGRLITQEDLDNVRTRDESLIAAVQGQRRDLLFAHICEDQDARRVCGFPSLYVFIDLHDRLGLKYEAMLFSYEQAMDWENDRCVTFMGMGCYC